MIRRFAPHPSRGPLANFVRCALSRPALPASARTLEGLLTLTPLAGERFTPGILPFALRAALRTFKIAPGNFVDHSATTPLNLILPSFSANHFNPVRFLLQRFIHPGGRTALSRGALYSGHPALRPSGRPADVQNCSRQFCRPLSHLSVKPYLAFLFSERLQFGPLSSSAPCFTWRADRLSVKPYLAFLFSERLQFGPLSSSAPCFTWRADRPQGGRSRTSFASYALAQTGVPPCGGR